MTRTAGNAAFWEKHYRSATARTLPVRPNPVLVDVVTHRSRVPGHVLDLGSGLGGDAVWLARQGWQVTAVDVAPHAVDHTLAAAAHAGVARSVTGHVLDVGDALPAGDFDLVSACYLTTCVEVDRADVLHRAAAQVVPRGLLLVVDRAPLGPAEPSSPPSPAQVLGAIGLGPGWATEELATRVRTARGPGGRRAQVADHVVVARRTSHARVSRPR